MQLHNTREALFDATIALAIAPGLPAAKELRDSCVDTAKFLSNRKLDLEQWSCPPGFCFKDTAKRTYVPPFFFFLIPSDRNFVSLINLLLFFA